MNTDHRERLLRAEFRAHHRFMRRSNRSIAMFPQDRFELHRLAQQAARLAERIRVAERAERVDLLQLRAKR